MKYYNIIIKAIIIMIIACFIIPQLDCLNLITETAYAASYNLTDIQLESSGGKEITLYKNNDYTGELKSNASLESKYYAKVSADISKIVFTTSSTDGVIKIYKYNSNKVYDSEDEIPLFSGNTAFYIRVYDTYDESKPSNFKKEYKVLVRKYTYDEQAVINNDNQDEIYLHTIQLNNGDIPLGFDKQKPTYDVKVNDDVKSINIKAEPDDGSRTVKINNITVDENDNYKKNVNLDEGKNVVKISLVQDEDEKRVYTLNIYREKITVVTENNAVNDKNIDEKLANNTSSQIDDKTPNKWIKVSDKWMYNDGYGNHIKNNWYYDSTYRRNYYFDDNGNMVTGWVKLNSDWYYLNSDGAMEIGWKQLGDNWYYFDYDGKMKTGWFKDVDGKYYYLYEANGVMAHDTKIGAYKLGSNGVWSK